MRITLEQWFNSQVLACRHPSFHVASIQSWSLFLGQLARSTYTKLQSWRARRINKVDFRETYPRLVRSLKQSLDYDKAMRQSVGGEFEAVGVLEFETLKHYGLKSSAYVIDVGCGSGRLAKPLSNYLAGRYLGIDVVPELVRYARRLVGRSDWRFEVADGLTIPERDGVADVVCFFSVFTHLLHEQSYIYLCEARRVLKEKGLIVFSFIDFTIPSHWEIFESNIRDLGFKAHPLNMFMSRDGIRVWAGRLGLQVEAIMDGDKPFVPLVEPLTLESGHVVEGLGTIGQSVCVLRKSGAIAGMG